MDYRNVVASGMSNGVISMESITLVQSRRAKYLSYLKRNWWLYVFVIPTIVWYIVFHYVPMGGIVIAFKRYNGVKTIWESKWVGLKWFKSFRVLREPLVSSRMWHSPSSHCLRPR